MKIFFAITLLLLELNGVFSCIILDDIECSCEDNVIECTGNGEDEASVQELFFNISQIHFTNRREHLILNFTNLIFPANLNMTDLNISSLSIIGGLHSSKNIFFGSGWRDLKSLKIQNGDIGFLEDRLFLLLHNLIELNLDTNEIFDIDPNVFFSLEKLEYLSLSKNQLKMASKDLLHHLPALHTLILNENTIAFISNISIVSESLTKLIAQRCGIGGSLEEDSLSGTPNLTYIDLSLNEIENINAHAFSALVNIETLNMSYNRLANLGKDAFAEMKSLVTLDLSNNKIIQMKTGTFAPLTLLRNLNLSSNMIKAMLCDYTSSLHSLETLDLRLNVIRIISPGALLSSPNMKELLLEGNILDETLCLSNLTEYVDIALPDKDCNMADSCMSLSSESDTTDDYPYYLDEEDATTGAADETTDETRHMTELSNQNIKTTTNFEHKNTNADEITTTENTKTTTENSLFNTTEKTITNVTIESELYFTTTNFTTEGSRSTVDVSLLGNSTGSTTLRPESTVINSTNEILYFTTPKMSLTTNNSFVTKTELEDSSKSSLTSQAYEVITGNHSLNYSIFTEISSTIQHRDTDSNTESPNIQDKSSMSDIQSPTATNFNFSEKSESEYYYDYDDEKSSADTKSIPTLSITTENKIIPEDGKLILVDYKVANNKLCVEYSIQGAIPKESKCVIRYDLIKGKRGFDHLKCPPKGIKQLHCRDIDMYKFCLILFIKDTPRSIECSKESLIEPSILPNTTAFSSTSLNVTISNYISDAVTTSILSTKKPQPNSTVSSSFKLLSFNVNFNETMFALAVWTVNQNQSLTICNLTLSLSSANEVVSKSYFVCSNYSYPFVMEDTIDEICLTANHRIFKSEKKCKHKVILHLGATASRKKDHGFKNTSLIALGILLLIVVAIIIILIIRNLTKKKLNKDRYNVYFEEQNVQKRLSSFHQDSEVRYSFTPKE